MRFAFCRAAARAAAVLVFVAMGASPAFAITKTWTNNNGSGDGKWGTASNWNPSGVPTSSDDVEIGVTDMSSNYLTVDTAATANSLTIGNAFTNNPTVEIKAGQTLTIASASSVAAGATLYLNNGNLAGAGALTVSGNLNVAGGTVGGSGALTLNSGAVANLSVSANYTQFDRDVANAGTMNFTGGGLYDFYLLNSSVITNSGTIDFQGDENLWTSGAGPFGIDNQSGGLVKKSSGSIHSIKCSVNNASGATIQTLAGTMSLEAGGSSVGAFDIAAGTVVNIASATYNFNNGTTVTGLGKIAASSILNIPTGADVTIPNLQLVNGSAKVDGAGTLRIATLLQWDGGYMSGGGLTIITSSASLNIACSTNYCYLDNRQLNIAIGSSATYTASTYALYFYNSASLNLATSATLNIQTDQDLYYGGGTTSTIDNGGGTIQKTSGTGVTQINVPLTNSGTLSVTSGDLQVNAGATLNGGTINTGTTSNFDVTSSLTSISSAVTVSGTGNFRVTGGTLRIPTGVTQLIPRFSLVSPGVVDGGGTLQLSGVCNWTGGTMGSSSATGGTTEVLTGATLNITSSSNYNYLDYARQLVNDGTVTYNPATYSLYLYNGSDITNNNFFNIENDGSINISGSGSLFTNNATLQKSSGTGATGSILGVELDNAASGAVIIQTGRLSLAGKGTSAGNFTISAGTFLQITNEYDFSGSPTMSSTGTLRVMTSGHLIVPTGVTLTVPVLSFEAGYMSGGGTLRLSGTAAWTAGTMGHPTYPNGTTEVLASAQLDIASTNYVYLDQGRTLTNNGTINYTPATYGLWMYNGATLNNNTTFNYDSDIGIGVSGTTTFNNSGTILKDSGTGAPVISPTLHNSGTIQVDSGSLFLGGNGTHTGIFTSANAGTLGFSNGTHTLSAASSLTGTGIIAVSGGSVTTAGSYNPAKLTVSGGSLTLDSNGSTQVLSLVSSGIINGSGTFTIQDDSTWSGGTMSGSGTTVLDAGQTLTISATTNYCYLDTRTFTNNGTIAYTATTSNNYLYLYNNGVLNNAGAFNAGTDQFVYGQANGTFNNSGTFAKTGGTGNTIVYAAFNNSGNVNVGTGTVSFNVSGTHTGNFTPASPGTIAFLGGTHTISAPAVISGTGTLAFTGANVTSGVGFTVGTLKVTAGTGTFNANGSADTLDMSGGTLGGTGTLTLSNGGSWTAGTMTGTGTTVVPASQTLGIAATAGYPTLDGGRTLANNGTINYTATLYTMQIYNGAALTNNGVFNYQTDQQLLGSNGTFNNAGTFNRSSGSGVANISAFFHNTGSVSITTGTVNFNNNGTHTGTWTVTSPATLNFGGGTHSATAGSIGGTGTLGFTGAAFTASIPYTVGTLNVTNGTATMNGNGAADAFTMSGGIIAGTGTLTLNNGGTWTAGVMQGGGTTILPSLKTLAIDATAGYPTLDNRTFNNNGVINYTASPYNLQIYGATLNNSGAFNINGGAYIWGSAGGTLNNSGTLNKTAGPDLEFSAILNNSGSVTVSAGKLSLTGGGTHANGVFTSTSPGTIQFGNGTHTLSGTGSMGGTGNWSVIAGTVDVGVPYALANFSMANGTINFNTNGTIGPFNITFGTLGGTGTVTFTDSGTWAGGDMRGTGTSVFSAGKTYTIGGSYYTNLIDNRTLTNNGTINYVEPTYHFQVYNNGVLNNAGTLALQTDQYLWGGSGGTINNSGTISRTTGTGNSTILYPVVNNNGTVTATVGNIEFGGGGSHNGTFSATNPSAILFSNGTHTVNPSASLNGTGRYRFTGGTTTVDGTWTGIPIDITSGTLNLNTNGTAAVLNMTTGSAVLGGTGNVLVAGNSTWSGGTMQGTGTTTFDTGVTIDLSSAAGYTTLARPLLNNGTVNYSASTYYLALNGATLTNAGVFDVQTAQIIYAYGTSPSWVNNGTLKKTAGTGTMQFYPPISNAGTVQVGSGTMHFSNSYAQSAGITELLNNAMLQTVTLDINGGSLIGTGTVAGHVTSDGIVAPGNSAGTLTITGNYTQSAAGDLNIELGGTTAGTGYDQLVVQGAATLDGDLNVSLINSFFPASGNTFQILTFGSRPGSTDFASKNGLSLGSGTDLIPAYSATDLQLTTNTVQTDLSISMGAPATVSNGSSFSWSINVVNGGGSNASGVAVNMTLPANVVFTGSSPAICTGAPNLVCTFGNIPNGGNASVTVTATANGSGSASTSATVTGSQFDPNGTNNTAVAGPTITSLADLGVSIADSPDPVAAGAVVTYTITVTNAGPDTANAVTLSATPSANLTFNSATGPCTGGFPCSLGNLGNGASSVITSNWTVSPTATGTAQLAVAVSATSPTDPDNSDDSATASTGVAQDADVQVIKTGPTSVSPDAGNTVTYNIAVTNNGPSIASAVSLDDPTPANLTLVSVTGDCTAFPCAIGTMTVAQSKNVQVVYQINGAVGTTFINTATVTSGADSNGANDSSSVTTTVSTCPSATITAPASVNGGSTGNAASVNVTGATYNWSIGNGAITSGQGTNSITFTAGASGTVSLSVAVTSGACSSNPSTTVPIVSADLVVTKTGPASVSPTNAGTVTYTINVTNNGPSAAGSVTLSDPQPNNLTFVSATGACTAFPCALGTLASGQSVSTQATYSFTGGTQKTVTNVATATSSTPDPNGANNSGSASTLIAACPAISITGPSAMQPGDNGAATATAVNGATYNWSITNGTITSGNGTDSITFTAAAAGTTTLNVTVAAGQCTGNASLGVPVTSAQADVTITKSAPSNIASAAQFSYTLAIGNNGPASADAVSVADSLPAGVTFVSVDSASCSGGAVVSCSFGTLAAGATQTVNITVIAPQGPASLTNTAQVSTTSADPIPSSNTSTVVTTVAAPPEACPVVVPALNAPADGDNTLTSPVTFSWSLVLNAITYELWIGPSATNLSQADTTTGTSASLQLSSGTYSWQVIARGASSCSPRLSDIRTFTILPADTCADNAAPTLASPIGGTINGNVTFSWNATDGAIGYIVRAGVNGAPLQELGSTAASVTTLTTTVPPGTITWAVDALYAGCPALRSQTATFTVSQPAACEGTAVPTAPANGSTTSDASIDFAWNGIASATGYRIWLQTGTGAPEVIGTTLETSLTKTVAAGTHTFWIETLFDGCPSRESIHLSFTVLPANNCDGRGRPSLLGPDSGITVSNAQVTFSWTAVTNAIEYELYLALDGGVPTLIATTPSTSHTAEVAAGNLEWFVRAIFSGCQPTESDRRIFTYTPPANCAANTRPVLIAPAEGERVASPALFDWNEVPGATGYELYVDDQLVASPADSQATVNRPNGAGRWFVRAKFAQPCASLDSSESRFVIVPQAAACSALDAPSLAAPGRISSGIEARVQWSFVPGATSYSLQISGGPDFGAGTETIDEGNARQEEFTIANHGNVPVARYLRVRAHDSRCNPATAGPWSETAILYILPETTTEASSLIGESEEIEYSIPLSSELAGQPFTATPTAPWISVVPSSGTVPAAGMFLTVTAHTAGLPPGTNIGGVTVTIGTAGRISANGGTSVSTPITVNLVSPVTPVPKTTPPPDALVIPAVANADGIGSHFQSDVRVSNTSAQVMKYQLSYIPTGEAGMSAGRQTTFSIEPGRTVALDDILKSWFGTGTSNAIGTLEVRPLTEVAKSTSSAALGALANIVTFASSRTFNVTPSGTFGQYIPAIPFANFIGKSADALKPTVLSLQQIAHSAKYRTNLGLVEGSGQSASLLVKVFNSTGVKLTEFPVNLSGGQHTQLNGFLAQHNVGTLDDGRVEVEVVAGSGKVTAYASVLDNSTSDPLLVSPVTLTDDGNTRWVVPGVADIDTGGANWQTDVRVFNAGSTAEQLTLSFHSMNGGEPKTASMTLQPGEVRQLDRILANTFGATQNGGAVHITTADSARLIATARTYNLTTQGTYGQFISAVTPAEAAAVGSRPLQLLQVEESSRYRSNIGLAEVTGQPVTLEVAIVPPDAKFTASVRVDLAANEFRQLNSLLAGLGLGDTYNARISIRAVAGEGRATAYASVIDLQTNDPTLIPAQ